MSNGDFLGRFVVAPPPMVPLCGGAGIKGGGVAVESAAVACVGDVLAGMPGLICVAIAETCVVEVDFSDVVIPLLLLFWGGLPPPDDCEDDITGDESPV